MCVCVLGQLILDANVKSVRRFRWRGMFSAEMNRAPGNQISA